MWQPPYCIVFDPALIGTLELAGVGSVNCPGSLETDNLVHMEQ